VTGVAIGATYITYTLATGCKLDTPMHVNPAPAAITGWSSYVTVGTSATYTDATPGGIWTSSNPAKATVGITSGLVTGVSAGVTTLSYTIGTGCSAIRTITVSALGATNPGGDGEGTINVSPNPNKGSFSISGTLGTPLFMAQEQQQQIIIEVTDLLGQIVFTDKIISQNGNINTQVSLSNALSNGMYLLNLRSDTERRVFHIVIEK